MISSHVRYDHFDTLPYKNIAFTSKNYYNKFKSLCQGYSY